MNSSSIQFWVTLLGSRWSRLPTSLCCCYQQLSEELSLCKLPHVFHTVLLNIGLYRPSPLQWLVATQKWANVTPPKMSMIDGYTFFHCFAGYCCSDLNWTTVSLPLLGFSVVWLEWYWWRTGSPSHPIHAPTLASTTIMSSQIPSPTSAWTLAQLYPVAVSGQQMVPLFTMGQLWKTRR